MPTASSLNDPTPRAPPPLRVVSAPSSISAMCGANLGGAAFATSAALPSLEAFDCAAGSLNRGWSAARASRTASRSSDREEDGGKAGRLAPRGVGAGVSGDSVAFEGSASSSVSTMGSFSFCAERVRDTRVLQATHAAR